MEGKPTESARARKIPPRIWVAVSVLVAYLIVLMFMTLTSASTASLIGPLFGQLGRRFPWMTFVRLEFVSNILLFVPLGAVLTVLFERARYLVFPLAFVASVGIEATQSLAFFNRVPSTLDIIANTAGACVGLILVVLIEALTRRRRPADHT